MVLELKKKKQALDSRSLIPSRIIKKKYVSKHSTVKFLKTKDKKNIFKQTEKKRAP